MKFGINTLDDFKVNGKTVICRIDINQPIDRETGKLRDTSRIMACVPTIEELSEKGAKLVLLAHQGSDIEYENFWTLMPHAQVLSDRLNKKVDFIPDVCGPAAIQKIKDLGNGEILLLDNVRFMSEEQTIFERQLKLSHEEQAKTIVVRRLAPIADIYVCDAFAAAHRDQPSLCGFEEVLPTAMGRLFEKEYCILSELMQNPKHPCTFVLGGAKIADAFLMMNSVLAAGVADHILTGGLAANIFLAALGKEIGRESLDYIRNSGYEEYIAKAKDLYERFSDKILVPVDLAQIRENTRSEAKLNEITAKFFAVDIGKDTAERYRNIIASSETVFVNGPMGKFETEGAEYGTEKVWQAIAETKAFTVVGGGDSITAAAKYNVTDKIDYICTGGGALIRFLSGKTLPVVEALRHGTEKFGSRFESD